MALIVESRPAQTLKSHKPQPMTEAAILCVDDKTAILESLPKQIGRYFGDQCLYEAAESAKEALEILQQLDEEVVIVSDGLIPDIRGDELLIQVHQQLGKITTIMLTGQADESAIELEAARSKSLLLFTQAVARSRANSNHHTSP
ncbi:MAG: response regulator [Microcoleaceae cyanobacterium]